MASFQTAKGVSDVTGSDLLRLRLSLADMFLDGPCSLQEAQSRLFRDNPETVKHLYDITMDRFHDESSECGSGYSRHYTTAPSEYKRQARTACLFKGVTVAEIAADESLWRTEDQHNPLPSIEATRRLLTHHGWLKLAPYGRSQSRTLATEKTVKGGYGQNVDPSEKHSIKISGGRRSFPFPVFRKERLPEVVASLGWPEIISSVSSMERKQERQSWLLHHHTYLPSQTVSELSGTSITTVKRARADMAKPALIH